MLCRVERVPVSSRAGNERASRVVDRGYRIRQYIASRESGASRPTCRAASVALRPRRASTRRAEAAASAPRRAPARRARAHRSRKYRPRASHTRDAGCRRLGEDLRTRAAPNGATPAKRAAAALHLRTARMCRTHDPFPAHRCRASARGRTPTPRWCLRRGRPARAPIPTARQARRVETRPQPPLRDWAETAYPIPLARDCAGSRMHGCKQLATEARRDLATESQSHRARNRQDPSERISVTRCICG